MNDIITVESPTGLMLDAAKRTAMLEFARAMSEATVTVPQHFRGKPGDCLAVTMQAMQWGMNPFAVAQKTHLVNGALGYEAQLVNAVVCSSGLISGHFHYEYRGEGSGLECRVGAALRGDSAITWGEWLSVGSVQTKNSPLWKTNPRQQMGYLQVKNWARLYAPGAILGIYTDDELDQPINMGAAERVSEPPAALPVYTDEALQNDLAKVAQLMRAGKKTPDQLIATIKSKYTMTTEQEQRFRDAAKPETAAALSPEQAAFVDEMGGE